MSCARVPIKQDVSNLSERNNDNFGTPEHRDIDVWLVRREALLTELSVLYRIAATAAASGVRRDLATLDTLERSFRKVMQRHEDRHASALSPADRDALLSDLAAASAVARRGGWCRIRRHYWKALYGTAAGQAFLRNATEERYAGRPLIRIDDNDQRLGKSPQLLDFDHCGKPRYIAIDVRHRIPLDRNPFAAYSADNVVLEPGRINRYWLRRYGIQTGQHGERNDPDGTSDDIEAFVRSHRLLNRPQTERRRQTTSFADAASMLRITLGISEARAVFDAARETSACLERRLAPENRGEGVPSRGLDGGNLSEVLGAVFDRHPLELNVALANEVDLAAAQWLRRDYQKGGSRFEAHERAVSDAWARRDENTLCRLMEAAGHPQLMHTGNLAADAASGGGTSEAWLLEDARLYIVSLLEDEATYAERAEAAYQLSQRRPDDILSDTSGLVNATAEDAAMAVYDSARSISNQYRIYVSTLRRLLDCVAEAQRVNLALAEEIFDMLENLDCPLPGSTLIERAGT